MYDTLTIRIQDQEITMPGTEQDTGRQQLERITVNFVPRASEALQQAVELTRDSKTDTLNRAIQLYAYVLKAQAGGQDLFIGDVKDGKLDKILLM
jgi:hypothetical protein